MTFDVGTIVSLVFGLAFIGFIVGAELHSRRLRRDNVEQRPSRVTPTTKRVVVRRKRRKKKA